LAILSHVELKKVSKASLNSDFEANTTLLTRVLD
jgi:hypothetical protein